MSYQELAPGAGKDAEAEFQYSPRAIEPDGEQTSRCDSTEAAMTHMLCKCRLKIAISTQLQLQNLLGRPGRPNKRGQIT